MLLGMFGQPKPGIDLNKLYLTPPPQPPPENYWRSKATGRIAQYHPTLGDALHNALRGSPLGSSLGDRTYNFLNDLTPVGNFTQAFQTGQDLRAGNWLQGGLGAALAALAAAPEIGGALKHLPEPSMLSLPRPPTPDEMRRLGRVADVPLAQARHGNKLQRERFNRGDYGSPLVPGYADRPLAVQLENGEYVLLDGNHRAALANANGVKVMPMHVIPAKGYDPANAGRTVKPPSSVEIDQLLSQLRP